MFKILTLNQISIKGLERFSRERYEIASEIGHPDAILLRSHQLTPSEIMPSLQAIARAGAGVNNIPVGLCTEHGIPVFNTPGANANAVKELVLSGLLLSSRGILDGIRFVKGLSDKKDANELKKIVEKEKKNFKGQELAGKTLGVVGLGAIGSSVAESGLQLGMEVLGYDPGLSVDAAWRLSSQIQKVDNLPALLSKSDYITLHLPMIDSTRGLINNEIARFIKKGARLLNFSRDAVVVSSAIVESLESGNLAQYISDFPTPDLVGRNDVILMPHIGASTNEAEENCAVMAANQLIDFLEHGNINNSVNYPRLVLERSSGYRIALSNRNIPTMLSQVLTILAEKQINVIDMLNKSRENIAYNLIDIDTPPSEELISVLEKIEGVVNVRSLIKEN